MSKISKRWKSLPLTVKASVAYTVCSILQKSLSLITMPLFTRLLTTEQYGQLTIYHSWSAIIAIFTTLNLAYGSFSTAMIKYEEDRDGYISSVQGIFVVLSLVFLVIYFPFANYWNLLFELPTHIMCIMIAEILCSNCILLWSGKKRFEYKYKSIVAVTLSMSILSPVLAYVLVVNSEEKGYARIIGYAAVVIAAGLVFFTVQAIRGKKLFDKKYWKFALGFNVPLLVYYLSQFVFNQSDRIMISHIIGKDKAAIYGVAYSLATVLLFILTAINNSYVPWYYGKIKEGKMEDNRNVANGIALLMMLMFSGVIWFAPEIIRIMAGQKYAEAVYVVAPIAVSMLIHFYTQLFVNVEFFFEEKKSLVSASIVAAVTNIVLNWLALPVYGFLAAAYTTLLSFMIFCGSNYLAMKRLLKQRNMPDVAFDYKILAGIFVLYCILSVIGVMLYGSVIIRAAVAACVLLFIVIRREKLIGIYKEIKRK